MTFTFSGLFEVTDLLNLGQSDDKLFGQSVWTLPVSMEGVTGHLFQFKAQGKEIGAYHRLLPPFGKGHVIYKTGSVL